MNNHTMRAALGKVTCACILLLACTTHVCAQSSVTVFGRVVAGIDYQSSQMTGRVNAAGTPISGGVWTAGGNEWGTSFFGFSGEENLGDGLKALFTLENGFSTANGVVNGGSGLWNRRSYVGFTGGFGTLKFGRDLTLPSDVVWSMDPTGQQAMSTA
ncbi:MAG TPA: porin, partial [Burkholderiaceae bacterium]|nr:porin [Burkholderiaceae bacterium]